MAHSEKSGWLLVDKPAGPTSHDVVFAARKLLGTGEIGHAGTLDPPATGLLLLAVGGGTALLQFLNFDKSYRAVIRLGTETDTLDAAGTVTKTAPVKCTPEEAEAAVRKLAGKSKQRAPMVSAVKVRGRRLHAIAREGGEVAERPEKNIVVSNIVVAKVALPDIEFDVDVTSGTYIRVLAEDVGKALGCGAHLLSLRRTRVGPFHVKDAVAPSALTLDRLIEPRVALDHIPVKDISASEVKDIENGRSIDWKGKGFVRLEHKGAIFAIAEGQRGKALPRRVFKGGLRV